MPMTPLGSLFAIAAAALAALLMARDARADGIAACIDIHLDGQRLRDKGQLKGARQRFLACSAESCPALVRKDCLQWLAEVDEQMPTLLISAHGPAGLPTG